MVYSHVPLAEQLALGVRGFELDVHLTEDGELQVFHLPVFDAETTCLALEDCLVALMAWSDAHPCHAPVMIWVEPKDDIDSLADGYDVLEGAILDLDSALREQLAGPRFLAPDDLRGDHDTLRDAVLTDGWPTLGELRGAVLVSLLDSGDHRQELLDQHPELAGRSMFVQSGSADEDFAATMKRDSPEDELETVAELLGQGFLITSNADSVTGSDEDNAAQLAATLAAGSHYVATDFPSLVDGRAYVAEIPGGAPVGCNPVTAPPECTAEAIEDLPD